MKTLIFTFVLFFTLETHAQKITVTESGDALVTTIYETDPSDILSSWKSQMKKYNAKIETGKDKIIARGAVINTMSAGTWDITATLEKIKTGEVKFTVIFDPIASAVASSPDKKVYLAVGNGIVKDFAYKCSNESISDQLKDSQKACDKLVRLQDGIIKENANLADDINGYKKKITDAERQVTMNKDKIETKNKEIESQKKVIDEIKERQKDLN
jgi:hypothetical protein